MFEVDFLAIEKTGEAGSKSGDAISFRFTDHLGRQRVVVIDGGYKDSGDRLVEHIQTYYNTSIVDLVISTHPDADHLNGLASVLDQLTVRELLIHRPHFHTSRYRDYSNIEAIDALIALADERGVTITEPFTGLARFGGAVQILGPTDTYYEQLLAEDLSPESLAKSALALAADRLRGSSFAVKARDLLDRVLTALPFETLGEDGDTSPRNNSSAITLLTVDGERLLFTGDAGIDALDYACDEYERIIGVFANAPLRFFQAPHHGSRHNLAPSILNRIFGKPGDTHGAATSFVSSAKADPKHPSPKVTNALQRRDVRVFATEGTALCHYSGTSRPGWSAANPVPPLDEDDD